MELIKAKDLADKVADLFSQDQKDVIEFMQGNRHMTIQKQYNLKFGGSFIRGTEETFLDAFAMELYEQRKEIAKIKLKNDKLNELLSEDGFADTVEGSSVKTLDTTDTPAFKNTKTTKNTLHNFKRTEANNYLSSMANNRGGATSLNKDFTNQEERWKEIDKQELKEDRPELHIKNVAIKINEEGKASIEEFPNAGGITPMEPDELKAHGETYPLNELQVSRASTKTNDLKQLQNESINTNGTNSIEERGGSFRKTGNVSFATNKKEYSKSLAIMKALINTDLPRMLECFWNSFEYLFIGDC